jgi:hypothetical protein
MTGASLDVADVGEPATVTAVSRSSGENPTSPLSSGRKRPVFQRGIAGEMARRLLCLWVAPLLLMPGCMLPQDIHYLDEIPPGQNLPPLILQGTAVPTRQLTITNLDPCAIEFRANVYDLNIGDRLQYKWYVDFDPANPQPPVKDEVEIPADGFAARAVPAFLDIPLNQPGYRLGELGTHVVELLVADGELIGRTVPPPTGGIETFVTSYAWTVSVEGACTP